MELSVLRELQSHFENTRANTKEAEELYEQAEKITKQFQQRFSMDNLRSMTLEEYVVGRQSKDAFCYWLEKTADPVGGLGGGGSGFFYNVFYSEKKGSYVIREGEELRAVSEDEARKRFEFIKSGLIELLNAAEKKNFEEMRRISKNLPLDQHVIGKIICLYFPDKYLGLFSNRYMDESLKILGLWDEKTEKLDSLEKKELLLAFKENDDIMKNWPNRKYMDFLFHEILKKEILKEKSPSTVFFVLRTGGGEYADQPRQRYNFKEGIPGYRKLVNASGNAKFVYLENGLFYAKGEIGKIEAFEKDGKKYFNAQVKNYQEIEHVRLEEVKDKLSVSITRAGIAVVSAQDYDLIAKLPPPEKPLFTKIKNLLESKKQIILYGPPGTGKTYIARSFTEWFLGKSYGELAGTGQVCFITFHPSYSYEEFVEGVTANTDEQSENSESSIQYVRKWGIFKKLCALALATAMKEKLDPQRPPWFDQWRNIFEKFRKAEEKGNFALNGKEWSNAEKIVLIIDEINRGDISKIFGELVTLLENDKRLCQENEITVDLPYSNDRFGVPPNLYIIGTMNTADRSIALVDVALRRRFGFVEVPPNFEELRQNYLFKYEDKLRNAGVYEALQKSVEALEKINREIVKELGRDKQIGHSFFFKVSTKEDLVRVWQHEILPLVEEYFYCDYGKILRVIGIDENNGFLNEQIGIKGFRNIEELNAFLNEITVPAGANNG